MSLEWKQLALEEPISEVDLWIRVYWYQGTPVEAQYNSDNQEFTTNLLCIVFPAWAISRWAYATETLENLKIFEIEASGDGSGVATIKLESSENIWIEISGNGRFYDDSAGTTNPTTQREVTSGALRTFYLKQITGTENLTISKSDKLKGIGSQSLTGWVSGSNAPNLIGTLADLSIIESIYITGNNEINGDIQNISNTCTYLNITGSNILTGNIENVPNSLILIYVLGNNRLTGNIEDLPNTLISINIGGINTITGDIQNLPNGLNYLILGGINTVYGDIANITSNLIYLTAIGYNTLNGDVAGLPNGITSVYIAGYNIIGSYTGKTWSTKPGLFYINGNADIDENGIDDLLIDFDADLTWSAGNVITLTGDCEPRTSASDAAVANMISEGATVITN